MVIDDFHVVSIAGTPPETNAPLIIDPDAVLACPVALQHFQPITRRDTEEIESRGGVDLQQLSMRNALYVGRQATAMLSAKHFLGLAISKALDHKACNPSTMVCNSTLQNYFRQTELAIRYFVSSCGDAKKFGLAPSEITQMAPGRGSCMASDHLTLEQKPVGFMYRELPDNDIDSGWRFFSGQETQEYIDDPANAGLHDVNTIANCDPAIIPHLDAPVFSAFERTRCRLPASLARAI